MTDALTHCPGCPQDPARVDVTHHPEAELTTLHCLDCGAHHPPAPDETGPLANPEPWGTGIGMRAMERPRREADQWPTHFTTDRSNS